MIWVILILAVLIVIGAFMVKSYNVFIEVWGAWLSMSCALILFVTLISLPARRFATRSDIKGFEAVRVTIENAKADGINYDDAVLQTKVLECNRRIAELKYWRTTIFWIYFPEEVEDLEFIK